MPDSRRTFIVSLFAAASGVAAGKKSQSKGPEVQLVDHNAKLEGSNVLLDGRVRNTAERPLRRLMVIYEILDSDKNVLTRQKGAIDEEELATGEEASFSAQIQYVARSVFYRFEFEDGSGRELRTEKSGPFPIQS